MLVPSVKPATISYAAEFHEHDAEICNIPTYQNCPLRICNHDEFFHLSVYTGHYFYAAVDASYHIRRENWRHSCGVCGTVKEYFEDGPMNSHSFVFRDGGHQTNGIHRYYRECTVCGFTKDESIRCSGPPCYAPFSVSIENMGRRDEANTISTVRAVKYASLSNKSDFPETYPCGHSSSDGTHESIPETYNYKAIDRNKHGYYKIVYYLCNRCGYPVSGPHHIQISSYNHSFAFEDLGHRGNMHEYRDICYTCVYTIPYALQCSGNPHVSPKSIPVGDDAI